MHGLNTALSAERILLCPGLRSVALALADIVHDRWASFGLLTSVTAIVAPLLLLRGVENGALAAIRGQFQHDPRSREVVVVGSYEMEPALLAELRAHPDTAFVLAEPRYLNATYPVRRADGQGRLVDLQLTATAPADPVLAGAPIPEGYEEMVLSARAAERLSVRPGDALRMTVRRRSETGRYEALRLPLKVIAVLPEERDYRESGYVSLELLRALELWREGVVDAEAGNRLPPPEALPETTAARLRLYARTLEGAPRLRRLLERRGIDARLREERIATFLTLSERLDGLLAILTVLVAAGLSAVMAITGWQRVLIRRRELAILRLLAFRRWELLLYPVTQTVVLGTIGFATAVMAASLAGPAIGDALHASFGLSGEAFVLRASEVGAAGLVTALLASLTALAGGWQAAGVEPAEVLHDA